MRPLGVERIGGEILTAPGSSSWRFARRCPFSASPTVDELEALDRQLADAQRAVELICWALRDYEKGPCHMAAVGDR